MISRSDGNNLKNLLENNDTVRLSIQKTVQVASGYTIVPGTFYINDVVVRNNNGTSEIYAAVGLSGNRDTASTFLEEKIMDFISLLMVVKIGKNLKFILIIQQDQYNPLT